MGVMFFYKLIHILVRFDHPMDIKSGNTNKIYMGIKIALKKEQVYIAYSAGSDRKLFAVKPTIKCLRCQIDLKNRIINTGMKQYDRISTEALQKMYSWFVEAVERLEKYEKRIATVSAITSLYEGDFINSKSSDKVRELDFWANYDNFMAFKKNQVRRTTYTQYNEIARNRLKRFFDRHENKYTSIDQIDSTFLIRFNEYFIEQRPLSAASYSHMVSVFKMFVRYLVSNRLLPEEKYGVVNFHLKRKEYENNKDFALSIKELQALYDFNDLTPAVKRNLDYFICNCLLGGLRWSDFKNLSFKEIDMMNRRVEVHTSKTRKKLKFPIFDFCYQIIKNYNPEVFNTEQRAFKELNNLNVFNRSLKEAAQKFYIINAKGEKVYPYHAKRQCLIQNVNSSKECSKPMWELFKASMARRTFITIMRRAGYGFEEAKSFTGHVNPVSYSRYSKVTEDDQKTILERAFGALGNVAEMKHMKVAR